MVVPLYVIIDETIEQPVDHENHKEYLTQRIKILIPNTIRDFEQVPVFFILGNEAAITDHDIEVLYKSYGLEMIFLIAEHRGYGHSITGGDQSLPTYVSIKQALADYHQVVDHYKKTYRGPWIAAGYSYGGGLSINIAHDYPDDIDLALSSSGVVDWSFLMDSYDLQVRKNLGDKLYNGLLKHVGNLKPNKPFDDNWIDREIIIAFISGFSQMDAYNRYFPIFRLLSKLSTPKFMKILKWMDRKIALNGAGNYAYSNAKLTLTHEEALTGIYSWRVWRYQQFFETGVFWQSNNGVYQRTQDDLIEECKILFGKEPPLLSRDVWNPRSMVDNLKVPLIYINGGKDPWTGVCLEPDYILKLGKYIYFPDEKHCPDRMKSCGEKVGKEIMNILKIQPKDNVNNMIGENEHKTRIDNLKERIKINKLDAFIVSDSESIYYFTGASYKVQERPFFIVFWPDDKPTFVVPKLEEEHMEKASIGNVISYWEFPAPKGDTWYEKLSEILKSAKIVGIETSISLENKSKIESIKAEIIPLPLIETMRLVKSEAEIEMIRDVSRYADEGMELMLKEAYYGVSVLEMFSLSKKLQMKVIKSGFFDPLTTEFLTACWPAPFSAKPHGVPSINGRLKEGPLVAMSYHRINGYAAECERTFFLSEPSDKVKEMFTDMREARKRAFAMIRPGVKCGDVDKAAMDYLKEKGYGDYLLHRTGHGIGLGNHEGPWVAEGSDHVLEENMVISVEPGIYIPDIGGVRHSDTVLVTKDGYELLTKYPMDMESLTIKKSRIFKKLKGKIIQKAVKMRPE